MKNFALFISAALAMVAMAATMTLTGCKQEPPPEPVITITTQPKAPAALTEGSILPDINLTVAATVTEGASLTCQWYGNTSASTTGGTAISGATAASYTLPTDLVAGTYYYFCELTAERATPVRTDPVTVTVNAMPVITITTQPTAPTDLIEGEIPVDARLTVAASVDAIVSLSYQWWRYDPGTDELFEAIDGAIYASYTLPIDLAAGEHWYVCEVGASGAESKRTDPVAVDIDAEYGRTIALGRDGRLSWKFTDESVLVISGNVAMPDYNIFGTPWEACKNHIQTVVIKSGVTSIGQYAFHRHASLMSITIPNSVTHIEESAFYGCSSLKSIDIPNSVTHIEDAVFYDCSSLTSINIPDSVTSIGASAFYGCSSLTSIAIPNSVTSIGGSAFSGCSGLTSVTIPDSMTNIGVGAFLGCNSLTSITIPNSITTIENLTFHSCKNLTNITIPNSVTNIGRSVFYNCWNLTSVTIGSGVRKIEEMAFAYCDRLTDVTIMATTPPIIESDNFGNSGDTLHVPKGRLAAYRADPNWRAAFTDIVEQQ